MTAYQGGHLPRIEEAGHIAQEVKGDLLVMVALHAVCQILHHHSVASQQPLKINAGLPHMHSAIAARGDCLQHAVAALVSSTTCRRIPT